MKKVEVINTLERDSEGRINLDVLKEGIDYKKAEEQKGKRKKYWLEFEDNDVLVKIIGDNTYEDYSELLVSKLCEQLGFKSAHYDLCIFKDKKCVLTPKFSHEKETVVSGKSFMGTTLEILVENKKYVRKSDGDQKELNNLQMIRKCLSVYLNEDELNEVMSSFDMLFALNCFCLNGDIHLSNWSLIYNPNAEISYTLAPNYDAGSYFRFNLAKDNIGKHLKNLLRQTKMENVTKIFEDHIFGKDYNKHNSLNFNYESTEELGMTRLEEAYRKDPQRFDPIVQKLLEIDPYKVVDEVEKQIGVNVPEECSVWFVTVIERNQERLKKIREDIYSNLESEEKYER